MAGDIDCPGGYPWACRDKARFGPGCEDGCRPGCALTAGDGVGENCVPGDCVGRGHGDSGCCCPDRMASWTGRPPLLGGCPGFLGCPGYPGFAADAPIGTILGAVLEAPADTLAVFGVPWDTPFDASLEATPRAAFDTPDCFCPAGGNCRAPPASTGRDCPATCPDTMDDTVSDAVGGWTEIVGGASLLGFPPVVLPFTGVIPSTGTGLGGRLTGVIGFAVAPPSFGVAAGRNTGRAESLIFMSVTKEVGWGLLPVHTSVTMGALIIPGFAYSDAGFTGDAGFATCADFGFPPGAWGVGPELGVTTGIIPVVDGGTGAPGECSWDIWVAGRLGGTGTAGLSGIIDLFSRTTTGSIPGKVSPALLWTLALPMTGTIPVIVPVASTARTTWVVWGARKPGAPSLDST